jgi:hypothetical protein
MGGRNKRTVPTASITVGDHPTVPRLFLNKRKVICTRSILAAVLDSIW